MGEGERLRMEAGMRMVLGGIVAAVLWVSGCIADDWPQWMGPQRDGVWREDGILEKFPAEGPKILWRAPVGLGYSGPAVANGKVYVTDRVLATGAKAPSNPFDNKSVIPGTERVLCLNQATGATIWSYEYDCPYAISYSSGPRTTPLVSGGKVYTLGAEGNLLCLNADKKELLWSHEFKKDLKVNSPLWGFAASPLLDGNKLICIARGVGSTVMAYDKDTGKELWRALTAADP